MSVTIVVEVQLTPEAAAESRRGGYAEVLKTTRAFEGCEAIDAYEVSGEPGRFMIIERWISRVHYERYLDWRRRTGYFEQTAGRMVSSPLVRYLDQVA